PATSTIYTLSLHDALPIYYDRDGRLDLYFCLYNYYLGLEQYHYPAPYFDARNGPPNFLFHNEGSAKFRDRTEASGMNVERPLQLDRKSTRLNSSHLVISYA